MDGQQQTSYNLPVQPTTTSIQLPPRTPSVVNIPMPVNSQAFLPPPQVNGYQQPTMPIVSQVVPVTPATSAFSFQQLSSAMPQAPPVQQRSVTELISPKIKADRFDAKNLVRGKYPTPKSIPNKNPPQYYYEVAIDYNYGTPQSPNLGSLAVEWGKVLSASGVSKGDKGTSIFTVFPVINVPQQTINESLKVIMMLLTLQEFCNTVLAPDPVVQTVMQKFVRKDIIRVTFENGQLNTAKPPSMYLKVLESRWEGGKATVFTGINGINIPTQKLIGVEMEFIPVVEHANIYIGGSNVSIQCKIRSAIVTNIVAKNTISPQIDTLKELLVNDPNSASRFDSQMKTLEEFKAKRKEEGAKIEFERKDNNNGQAQGGQFQLGQPQDQGQQLGAIVPSQQALSNQTAPIMSALASMLQNTEVRSEPQTGSPSMYKLNGQM